LQRKSGALEAPSWEYSWRESLAPAWLLVIQLSNYPAIQLPPPIIPHLAKRFPLLNLAFIASDSVRFSPLFPPLSDFEAA